MRIGIDCRMYGPKHTGIGRYVQNLVENILELNKDNDFVLFVRDEESDEIKNLKLKYSFHPPAGGSNFPAYRRDPAIGGDKLKIVSCDIPHYSLKEQLEFPKIITKEKLDIMHFPHFNVPVFYKGKYIVTIHDLIKHSFRGNKTTTKSPITYWIKYFCYKYVFSRAISRAERIITPSQYVKSEVVKQFKINPAKVVVTYEGVSESLKSTTLLRSSRASEGQESIKGIKGTINIIEEKKIVKPYVLYVGNVYPHKNVERLIEAVKILNDKYEYKINLVVICARNVFSQRLDNYIDQTDTRSIIKIMNYLPDNELAELYKYSEAFVFPTLSEGFGLPGLEAMSLGCPVVSSDIPVLREVYKDCAVYFDPFDPFDIALKIKSLLIQKEFVKQMVNKGIKLSSSYSWKETAKKTLGVYLGNENCFCI